MSGGFRTIVADPPWRFPSGLVWDERSYRPNKTPVSASAEHHYVGTLSVEDICALPVRSVSDDDAYLWLWVPSHHVVCHDACRRVSEAWGFRPITTFVWAKRTPRLGFYLRAAHEMGVFAVRGSPGRLLRQDVPSLFRARNEGHSVKPDSFFRMVEDACPGPYLELFARRPRPYQLDMTRENVEWTCWGNEVGDPLGIGFDPVEWRKAS